MRIANMTLIAALLVAGAVQAKPPREPLLSAAELQAAGLALIEGSGGASELSLVGDNRMVRVKHDASGLVCTFSGRGQNKINVIKDPDGGSAVDCVMQSEGIAETWHIAKIDATVAYDGQFDSWTQALLAAGDGAKILKGKQGVEAMGVVDALAQTVTASKRAGWVASGGQLAYYGVADAGAWRITYIATGKPDTVKFLAPMVWLSGLGQIGQFKPVAFTR